MNKTELMIVTFKRDFMYLEWCLKSVAKFARGFSGLTILLPHGQDAEVKAMPAVQEIHAAEFPVSIVTHEEWDGAGMLCHEYQIMSADRWCPEADFVAHFDADCIFTEVVSPDDMIVNGKPILRYEPFSRIGKRHPSVLMWQECTEWCLPFPVPHETMRIHPEVYHAGLYPVARLCILQKTGKDAEDYIRSQKSTYPQGFCEFVTLGNVAIALFPEQYEMVEQFGDEVLPYSKMQQFWGHSPVDKLQNCTWVRGKQVEVVPLEFMRSVGL